MNEFKSRVVWHRAFLSILSSTIAMVGAGVVHLGAVSHAVAQQHQMGSECSKNYRKYHSGSLIKAFALSRDGLTCGSAVGYATVEQARKAALSACDSRRRKCRVIAASGQAWTAQTSACRDAYSKWAEAGDTFRAFALSGDGRTCGWTLNAASKQAGEESALSSCRELGDGCRITSSYQPVGVLMERQRRLLALGFYQGEIDGKWGAASKTALSAFQKAKGAASLSENELLDLLTRSVSIGGGLVPSDPPTPEMRPTEVPLSRSVINFPPQTAYFYDEKAGSPENPTVTSGVVTWSILQDERVDGRAHERSIQAEAVIPDRDITFRMLIRRNRDNALPASHLLEINILRSDNFKGDEITQIQRVNMKVTEKEQGYPLIGNVIKIAEGNFLVALADTKEAMDANLKLLFDRDWIDIPVVFASGARALLTLEKGASGDLAFEDAGQAWGTFDPTQSAEWAIQIASQPTMEGAVTAYRDLMSRHESVLRDRVMNVVRSEAEGHAVQFQVQIPAPTRAAADQLCLIYKASGGSCFTVNSGAANRLFTPDVPVSQNLNVTASPGNISLPDKKLLDLTPFRDKIQSCWNFSPSMFSTMKTMPIQVSFSIGGEVIGKPTPMVELKTDQDRLLAASAVRAIIRCAPYSLPVSYYEQWKTININFQAP